MKKLNLSRLFSWLTQSVGVAVLVGLVAAGVASATAGPRSPFENLRVFGEALAIIERAYLTPIDQDALIDGALSGLLASLDPHSVYLDPDEYRMLRDDSDGRFAGVGIEVLVEDGWLTVVRVFPGGPADEAGLLAGDRFLAIEGRGARDMRMREAIHRMRGPVGSTVGVRIRRSGVEEDLEFSLRRREVQVDPVRVEEIEGCTKLVRVVAFQRGLTQRLTEVLAEARGEQPESACGVVLDLRDNGGGLLTEAIELSDLFLSEGVIVSVQGRRPRGPETIRASSRGTLTEVPVVVLINSRTASAAEIVAGALRDHGRAPLVGVRSFGKGSVQSVVELSDGSAMKLTTAVYLTPSGQSIQALGVSPDVEIRAPGDEERPPIRERDLERHLVGSSPSATVRRMPAEATAQQRAPLEDGRFADDEAVRVALRLLQAR